MKVDKPGYLEAYPRLNLFDAKLSRRNGGVVPMPIVRYRVSGRMPAGCIYISARTQNHLVIEYWFPSLPYCQGKERTTMKLVDGPNGVDSGRQYLECESCGKPHSGLVFDGAWACQKCLGLRYRSQCIGTKVRQAEELDQIEARLGQSRPKHMHQAKYDRDRERAALLRQHLGFRRQTVSDEYADVVVAEWLSLDQIPESPHPDYEIVGGRMVYSPWGRGAPQIEPEKVLRMDPNLFDQTRTDWSKW